MAHRAESARKRRRTQTIIAGSAAAVVLVGAIVWIAIAASGDDSDPTVSASPSESVSASPTSCDYRPLLDPSASGSASPEPTPSGIQEVGKPEPNVPRSGKQILTIVSNLGEIQIEMDLSKTPCTAGSFAYLAGKKFFDNTKCHRMVTSGIFVLQCGDPSGTGSGDPRSPPLTEPTSPARQTAGPDRRLRAVGVRRAG